MAARPVLNNKRVAGSGVLTGPGVDTFTKLEKVETEGLAESRLMASRFSEGVGRKEEIAAGVDNGDGKLVGRAASVDIRGQVQEEGQGSAGRKSFGEDVSERAVGEGNGGGDVTAGATKRVREVHGPHGASAKRERVQSRRVIGVAGAAAVGKDKKDFGTGGGQTEVLIETLTEIPVAKEDGAPKIKSSAATATISKSDFFMLVIFPFMVARLQGRAWNS